MENINKRSLFYCLIIALLLNGYFFISQHREFNLYKKQGETATLYVKSLNDLETTLFQKAKYTKVAKTYFITSKNDTIQQICKNTWAMTVNAIDDLNFYIPLDSVIYDKHNPEHYELISEYRNYNSFQNALSYFVFGTVFFTIWLYLISFILKKGVKTIKNEVKTDLK